MAVKDAVMPGYDGEVIDYKNKTTDKLPLSKTPISVTVFKHGDHLIVDPTNDEEKVYDARLTVGVLEDGNVCSLQKGGDAAITDEEVSKMIEMAVEKSQDIRKSI
jgi:exosome complex component RRP42